MPILRPEIIALIDENTTVAPEPLPPIGLRLEAYVWLMIGSYVAERADFLRLMLLCKGNVVKDFGPRDYPNDDKSQIPLLFDKRKPQREISFADLFRPLLYETLTLSKKKSQYLFDVVDPETEEVQRKTAAQLAVIKGLIRDHTRRLVIRLNRAPPHEKFCSNFFRYRLFPALHNVTQLYIADNVHLLRALIDGSGLVDIDAPPDPFRTKAASQRNTYEVQLRERHKSLAQKENAETAKKAKKGKAKKAEDAQNARFVDFLKNLTVLDASQDVHEDEIAWATIFSTTQNLRVLKLRGWPKLTPLAVKTIGELKHLEHLELYTRTVLIKPAAGEPPHRILPTLDDMNGLLQNLEQCTPGIRILKLRAACQVNGIFWARLTSLPVLEELELEGFDSHLTPIQWRKLCGAYPFKSRLQTFILRSCLNMGGLLPCVAAPHKSFATKHPTEPKLSFHLTLQDTPVTEHDIATFKSCVAMRTFELVRVPGINHIHVMHFIKLFGPTLLKLKLIDVTSTMCRLSLTVDDVPPTRVCDAERGADGEMKAAVEASARELEAERENGVADENDDMDLDEEETVGSEDEGVGSSTPVPANPTPHSITPVPAVPHPD
ncbi:hypothetical protein HK104_010895, partial [Borealophlyctis nickersoniae]